MAVLAKGYPLSVPMMLLIVDGGGWIKQQWSVRRDECVALRVRTNALNAETVG